MGDLHQFDTKTILASFDEAVLSVLESYFFLEAIPKEASEIPEGVEIELYVRGPFSGLLHLSLSHGTAKGLLGSLALPADGTDENAIADVLAEIANAIGGRIAAALAGEDFAFDLTIPEVRFHRKETRSGPHLARTYSTDFGDLLLSVSHLEENSAMTKGA